MAEEEDIKQQIADQTEFINKLKETAAAKNENKSATEAVTDALRQYQQSIGISTSAVSGFITKLKDLKVIESDFDLLNTLVSKSSEVLKTLGADGISVMATFLNILPQNTALFGNLGDAGKKAGHDISESFGKLSPIIAKLPGIGDSISHFQQLIDVASQAQDLEAALLRSAAATGNLSKFSAELGGDFTNLQHASARYTNSINAVADASGMLPSQVSKFAEGLRNIPGAMSTTIDIQTKYGKNLSELNAEIKIANALGLDHAEVNQQLEFAWKQLNSQGQDALEMIARIGMASQDLQLPMDMVRQRVFETGQAFRMFGDQTNSAIDILANVRGALEDSNLGPAAIDQIVGSMTSGINKMDVAQKAFISGASGGPGGLFGAFEMDSMLRQQGGLQKVLDRTMEAMENQFGGPVITLEDVMATPALSGEFMKQISFLRDTAGIASSDQEAQRILEVMKKGGGAEELNLKLAATPEDALRNAIETGGKFQESQMTELTRISSEIEKAQMISARSSLQLVRIGQSVLSEEKKLVGLNQATADAKALGIDYTESVTAETEVENFENNLPDALDSVKEYGANVKESIDKFTNPLETMIKRAEKPKQETAATLDNILAPEAAPSPAADINSRFLTAVGLPPGRPIGVAPGIGEGIAPIEEGVAKTLGEKDKKATSIENILEGIIKIEVDVKDGVETIARKVVEKKIKDMQSGAFTGNSAD